MKRAKRIDGNLIKKNEIKMTMKEENLYDK